MRRDVALSPFVCLVAVLGLFVASCAPGVAPAPTPKPAAVVKETPIPPKPVEPAPTPKPAADQPQYGGVMTGWLAKEPPSTDPNQETTIFQQQVLRGIYSTLLRDDPEQQPDKVVIIGDLAEKWETSQDGKSWTFTLRDGVKFHDGQPLTSADVKFTFERMIKPPEGVKSPNQKLFEQISSIDASDPRTVRIQLKQATAWFPPLMADNTATIVPKHVVEPNQKALLLKALGSGPFKFQNWDRGVSFTVTKNEAHYIKGRPYLDGIRWIVIPDSSTQVAAFRAGQVLMTGQGSRGLSATEAKIVEKEVAGAQVVRYRATTRFELFINVKKGAFTDVRVRRAALMVLDGKAVYDLAYEGMGFTGGPLPGEWSLPKEELDKIPPVRGPKDSDISDAKKLLAEAGYPDGFKTTYAQGNLSPYEEMQLAVSNQLKKIGIQVTVRVLAYPVELRSALTKGDFEITQIGKISSIDDPDSYLTNYLTGNPENYSQFSDSKIDELYKQQGAILDFAQRKKITDEIQRRIWELAPGWTTIWPQYIAASNAKVKGWKGMATLRQNLVFDTTWLAK